MVVSIKIVVTLITCHLSVNRIDHGCALVDMVLHSEGLHLVRALILISFEETWSFVILHMFQGETSDLNIDVGIVLLAVCCFLVISES